LKFQFNGIAENYLDNIAIGVTCSDLTTIAVVRPKTSFSTTDLVAYHIINHSQCNEKHPKECKSPQS